MQYDSSNDGSLAILCLHSRRSRAKAQSVAREEAVQLLAGFQVTSLDRGPLVEEGVKVWMSLRRSDLTVATERLSLLGYTERVDALVPNTSLPLDFAQADEVRWNRQTFRRYVLVDDDRDAYRSDAPDKRPFLLEMADGAVAEIKGYRGSYGSMERRGLAVADARLLVNLARPITDGATLLDPFAGAGGVALAGVRARLKVTTVDVDSKLRFGLQRISGSHVVADARALPFKSESFDSIATEPPFDPDQGLLLEECLGECSRVLRPGAKAALMLAEWQADIAKSCLERNRFNASMNETVDRRGSGMVVLLLTRR